MAQGNFREHLKGENVWIKKYFYVLRPILACLWIEKNPGPSPMRFEELMRNTIVSDERKEEIETLLAMKKSGEELSWGASNPIINHFIENEIS